MASMADAAFATDEKGNIIAWNKSAERLLGYKERLILGKRCYEVLRGADSFGNRFCDETCPMVNMARRHEAVRQFEFVVRKADSEIIRTDVSVVFVPGQTPSEFTIIHTLRHLKPDKEAEDPGSPTPNARKSSVTLSPREIEVLRLLADGTSTRGITDHLHITAETARSHIKHILRKLKVSSRLEAVTLANRNRLI